MITFTNYICIGDKEVSFQKLKQKEQEEWGNHTRREPLTQFGEVKERKTA